MPDRRAATLHEHQGRYVLRLQRLLAHPAERVWEALTATDELRHWHPTPFEFDAVVGGQVRFRSELGGPQMPDGEVLQYDPPRVFAYTWGEDDLRWELRERPDGCMLVLSHRFADRFKAARDAAGWEICLVALSAQVDGATPRGVSGSERLPDGWRQLNDEYEQRFGIPPGKATLPPAM